MDARSQFPGAAGQHLGQRSLSGMQKTPGYRRPKRPANAHAGQHEQPQLPLPRAQTQGEQAQQRSQAEAQVTQKCGQPSGKHQPGQTEQVVKQAQPCPGQNGDRRLGQLRGDAVLHGYLNSRVQRLLLGATSA